MTTGEKIKEMRQKFNLSQEQLAGLINVSRQAITKWETDMGIPDINNLQALSKLFNISIDNLVNNSEIGNLTMTYELNKEKYGNKILSYSKILLEFFPKPYEIYNLMRNKKMTKLEAVLDFFSFGIHDDLDRIGDLSPYYLVKSDNKKYLVNIKSWVLCIKELPFDLNEKKFVVDNNVFVNIGLLKLKEEK